MIPVVALLVAVSCGDDGGVITGPDEPAIDGIGLAASVNLIPANPAAGIYLAAGQVTLTNTSESALTLHYPAGCPVRMRLTETGANGTIVYDEASIQCNVATAVDLTLQPGASTTLASTPRFPWDVAGGSVCIIDEGVAGPDCIPPGAYVASVILRIIGEDPIELDAGTYRLPRCIVVGPPGGARSTQCD
jgi:hypothetical protein